METHACVSLSKQAFWSACRAVYGESLHICSESPPPHQGGRGSDGATKVQTIFQRLLSSVLKGHKFPGGDRLEKTPVPIPNTAVKLESADGTARVAVWESR